MVRCAVMVVYFAASAAAQNFACPQGQIDVMKYFVLNQQRRGAHFMSGSPNPIYTQVFPDQDFAATGYWLWLKSPKAHGFDVKAFDDEWVYIARLSWSGKIIGRSSDSFTTFR